MKVRASSKRSTNVTLISQLESKKVNEALEDESWVKAIEEQPEQLDKNKVWTLVPKLENTSIIGITWDFKNKMDESGKVVQNKARLVAKGYSKQERETMMKFFTCSRLEFI